MAATVGLAVTVVACAAPSPTDDAWSVEGPPRDLPLDLERPEGRPGPNGGTLLEASSAPIEHAVAYRFALGHCGLASPIDLDGSFWDAIDGVTAAGLPLDLASDPEMINATGGWSPSSATRLDSRRSPGRSCALPVTPARRSSPAATEAASDGRRVLLAWADGAARADDRDGQPAGARRPDHRMRDVPR